MAPFKVEIHDEVGLQPCNPATLQPCDCTRLHVTAGCHPACCRLRPCLLPAAGCNHAHPGCNPISPQAELSGFGGWFDVQFNGSDALPAPCPVTLSTAPGTPTHWAQQAMLACPPCPRLYACPPCPRTPGVVLPLPSLTLPPSLPTLLLPPPPLPLPPPTLLLTPPRYFSYPRRNPSSQETCASL